MNVSVGEQLLKIGEVANASGLSVKTIRYYEEIGLLTPTVERSSSGYRLFQPQVLNRLAFVRRAQSLGLALNEIKDFLVIHDRGELPCYEVKQHLQDKVDAIARQIQELSALQVQLQELLTGWEDPPDSRLFDATICPKIQATESAYETRR